MKRLYLYLILLCYIPVLWNCQPRDTSGITRNSPPVVNDILVNPVKPQVSDTVMFNAVAVDPDGDPITINWKVSDGVLENDGRGNPIKYTPPNDSGFVSISCIINDGRATGSLTQSLFISMEPATLVGFVSDSRTHSMIGDAFVSLGDKTMTTGSNGFFRVQSTPSTGPQLLSISKEGFKLHTQPVKLRPGMNTINVALDKIPGTVYGIVRDRDSKNLLKGVRVALRDMEDSTSFSGYFEFRDVPVGKYTIIAKKTGYYTLHKTIDVKPGENQVDLNL